MPLPLPLLYYILFYSTTKTKLWLWLCFALLYYILFYSILQAKLHLFCQNRQSGTKRTKVGVSAALTAFINQEARRRRGLPKSLLGQLCPSFFPPLDNKKTKWPSYFITPTNLYIKRAKEVCPETLLCLVIHTKVGY